MKCIKAIKETKHIKVGQISRVTDQEADEKVDTKYWKFVPKSEWKSTKKVSTDQLLREHTNQENENQRSKKDNRKS